MTLSVLRMRSNRSIWLLVLRVVSIFVLVSAAYIPTRSASAFPARADHGADVDDQSYTITALVRLAPPYDIQAMNDEFQTARLIREENGVGEFEITYRPFHQQQITANPHWQKDDAGMTEYLRPRAAANWDEDLRQRILKDLRSDGIDPDQLDDKTLVEKVSTWAMKRSQFNTQFGLWMVEFKDGKPEVAAKLRDAFAKQEPAGLSDAAIFDRELFGKGMYENKTHGACTSTSTYLTTILRAIGIPTRIILTVPACDPNDPRQVALLVSAVRHHGIRRDIQYGLTGSGFMNHVFNEVWVGGKWARLNYNRLGQPIVDHHYEGLMTHVYTTNDISEVPFATTWGARFGAGEGPKLSSVNPYQLLAARDFVKPGARFDNPPAPVLTTATVVAILKPGDPGLPAFVRVPKGTDAILRIKEWIQEDDYLQLRFFQKFAGQKFTLQASGKPDVRAALSGDSFSDGSGAFQAMGIRLEGKPQPGVQYRVVPENEGHSNQWIIPETIRYIP